MKPGPGFGLAGWVLLASAASGAVAPALLLPDRISGAERARLARLMDSPFVSSQMALGPYPVRPEVFEYLLNYPELASHVARAIGAGRYRIWRTHEGLALDDGWGTTGQFRVVHAEPGLRIMHARGHYKHRLLPSIHGQALVIIRYHFQPGPGGRPLVETSLAGYVQLENSVLAVLGRVVAPFLQAQADRGTRQLLDAFSKVSSAIERDPVGVCGRLAGHPDVPPQELDGFRRVLGLS